MSFDIYGHPLKPGYCEVHPNIGEEYPCSLCLIEQEKANNKLKLSKNRKQEWEAAIEEEHRHNRCMDLSRKYRFYHWVLTISGKITAWAKRNKKEISDKICL